MDRCKKCGCFVMRGRDVCVQCEKNPYRLNRLSDYKQCMKCEHMSCRLAAGDNSMHCTFVVDEGKTLIALHGGSKNAVWKAREEGRCLGFKQKTRSRRKRNDIVIVGSEFNGKM